MSFDNFFYFFYIILCKFTDEELFCCPINEFYFYTDDYLIVSDISLRIWVLFFGVNIDEEITAYFFSWVNRESIDEFISNPIADGLLLVGGLVYIDYFSYFE